MLFKKSVFPNSCSPSRFTLSPILLGRLVLAGSLLSKSKLCVRLNWCRLFDVWNVCALAMTTFLSLFPRGAVVYRRFSYIVFLHISLTFI